MGFRGYGGYRGDAMDLGSSDFSPDFSDVSGGSSSVPDPTFSTMDPGSQLALPNIDYGQIVNNLAGGGIPSTISGIINAWKGSGGGGGGGGSAGPGVGSGGGSSGGPASPGAGFKWGKYHIAQRRMSQWSVRNSRRMNPANIHALRRSLRRIKSFDHIARSVYHYTRPAPHKSHFKFHRKRRRR